MTIRWSIQPDLWFAEKPITKSFPAHGIEFTIEEGKCIKAKLENPTISQEKFRDKTSKVVKQFMKAYILVEERFFEVGELICKYSQSKSAPPSIVEVESGDKGPNVNITTLPAAETNIQCRVMKTHERIDNDFNLSRKIFEYCERDTTLRGALEYYCLALAGIDQLASAGNLYMAMEELLAKFNEGKKRDKWRWEKITNNLNPFSSELTDDSLKNLRQLHRGRHAFDDNGNKNEPLPPHELVGYKKMGREFILAYVMKLDNESKI